MSNWAVGLRPSLLPMSRQMGFWRKRTPIRSIQAFVISGSGTSTTQAITSVDTANTIIKLNGRRGGGAGSQINDIFTRVALTSATQLTVTKGAAGATMHTGVEVIEYWPGVIRQVQRGTISMSGGATSGTYTISPAVQSATRNVTLDWLGVENDDVDTGSGNAWASLVLTNTTTVTATRSTSTGTDIMGVQVVEWW